jgi:exosortase
LAPAADFVAVGHVFYSDARYPGLSEGNVIDLGVYKLQVVEACSGLRYLYPLLGLGFLAAYLFQAPFWQRALVFLSTIPITILMNSLRIGIVGILVNRGDHRMRWFSAHVRGLDYFYRLRPGPCRRK